MRFIIGYFAAIGIFLALTFVWPMLPVWLAIFGLGSFLILWAILSLTGYQFHHPPETGTKWTWEGKTDD